MTKVIGTDSIPVIQEYVDNAALADTWVPTGYVNIADIETQFNEAFGEGWDGAFQAMASNTGSNPNHYLMTTTQGTGQKSSDFSQVSPKIMVNIDTPTTAELDAMIAELDNTQEYSSVRASTPWGQNIGPVSASWSLSSNTYSVSIRIFNPTNHAMLCDCRWDKVDGGDWELVQSEGSLTGIFINRAWQDSMGGGDDDLTWTQRVYIPGSYWDEGYDWTATTPPAIQKWVDTHVKVRYTKLEASALVGSVDAANSGLATLKTQLKSQREMNSFTVGETYPNLNFVFDTGTEVAGKTTKIPTGEENKKSLTELLVATSRNASGLNIIRQLLSPFFEKMTDNYYDYDYWNSVGFSLPMIRLNIGAGQSRTPAYSVPCTFVQYRLTESGTGESDPFSRRTADFPGGANMAVFRYEFTDKLGGYKYIFERTNTSTVDYGTSHYQFFATSETDATAKALLTPIAQDTYVWKEAL